LRPDGGIEKYPDFISLLRFFGLQDASLSVQSCFRLGRMENSQTFVYEKISRRFWNTAGLPAAPRAKGLTLGIAPKFVGRSRLALGFPQTISAVLGAGKSTHG
jgi:hypothetical protein